MSKYRDIQLVNFPSCTESYIDSEEGGLYVKLFVKADSVSSACFIDWATEDPNVIVAGYAPRQCAVSMVIGSTARALWHNEESRYWSASKKDLTPEGLALYNHLEKIYGEIIITTFLDT